ncbi:MAG TPA: hypothetical protein VN181_13085 [Thermoanaerobaculia bacterium]|nr:hypothetical protein [Thermoanaerobaculia bacterium]
MSVIAAAKAVVQLIGIVMVSRDLSPDHHLQALMPRISAPAPPMASPVKLARTSIKKGDPVAEVPAHVEEHAAFIAFPARDYLSSKGWPPAGLETVNGYLFVRLDGERVSFTAEVDAKPVDDAMLNQTARISVPIADASPARASRLGLPHLQPCCNQAALKGGFQPPDFPAAVAVVDLPTGVAKGCWAKAKGVSGRVDTSITIENGGVLLITATKDKQQKQIRLDGNSKPIVANLPLDVIGLPRSGGLVNHYVAYYDMIDTTAACPTTTDCPLASERPEDDCRLTAVRPMGGKEEVDPLVTILARVGFECSNTQWP